MCSILRVNSTGLVYQIYPNVVGKYFKIDIGKKMSGASGQIYKKFQANLYVFTPPNPAKVSHLF